MRHASLVFVLTALSSLAVSALQHPASIQQPAVSGTSRYADASFGFSFYYPSAWTVTPQPVNNCSCRPRTCTCSRNEELFQGGTILKQLRVHGSDGGIVLQEFRSFSGGIVELGASATASPAGEDVRYFLETKTRKWMKTITKSEVREGKFPHTAPADVSQISMGGLPVLAGAARFGADSIVPLSATTFVILDSTEPGALDQRYLAKTIIATNPSGGIRASIAAQQRTITDWLTHSTIPR